MLVQVRAAQTTRTIVVVNYFQTASWIQVIIENFILFSVRNSYLDIKLARLNAVIDLYQSLGGGWERSN